MKYQDIERSIEFGLKIKHKLIHDACFKPEKVIDITPEYVQIKGDWINSIYGFELGQDYISIKLEDLGNWKVIG